jgi:hypothetical protein
MHPESKSLLPAIVGNGPIEPLDLSPLTIGKRQVNRLHNAAVKGDAQATKDLVALAVYAAYTVQDFWGHLNWPGNIEYSTAEIERDKRRALLKQAARQRDDFPFLCSWQKSRNRITKEMRDEIEPLLGANGIWKTKKIKQDESGAGMHFLLHDCVYPEFEFLRASPDKLQGLEGEIQKLPRLTRKTCGRWATLAAKWCATWPDALETPGCWLHRLAIKEAEALFKKRITKAKKAFQRAKRAGRYAGRSGIAPVLRQHKIASMNVRETDFVNGLRNAIKKRLYSILKK